MLQTPVGLTPAAVRAPSAPLRVPLSRERPSIFVTLATVENHPVEAVLSECLGEMTTHLSRTRYSLHLDAADRVSLGRYLDSLEVDAEERAAREGATPNMLAAACASYRLVEQPSTPLGRLALGEAEATHDAIRSGCLTRHTLRVIVKCRPCADQGDGGLRLAAHAIWLALPSRGLLEPERCFSTP